mmetsp:Transcript_3914/g.4786  ORF Transcript_3914/g.4786 Transcript_3914/m.4786 type:complete len:168 (-) Transcript_3914:286-789(-)
MVEEIFHGEGIEELLQNLSNCQSEPGVILNHVRRLASHQDFPGLNDDIIATVKDLEISCQRLLAKCTSCLENQSKLREVEARVEKVVTEKESACVLAEKFLSYPKGDPHRLFAVFELQSCFPKELVTKDVETFLRYEVSLANCNVCKTIEEDTVNMKLLLTLLAWQL